MSESPRLCMYLSGYLPKNRDRILGSASEEVKTASNSDPVLDVVAPVDQRPAVSRRIPMSVLSALGVPDLVLPECLR